MIDLLKLPQMNFNRFHFMKRVVRPSCTDVDQNVKITWTDLLITKLLSTDKKQ